MLGLQIAAPFNRVFKIAVILFENFDCLGVGHSAEVGINNTLQTVDKTFIKESVEKCNFLRCIFKNVIYHEFQHILG